MTKLILLAVLHNLAGCGINIISGKFYDGESLPNDELALLSAGQYLSLFKIDGKELKSFGVNRLSGREKFRNIEILPGEHEIKVLYKRSKDNYVYFSKYPIILPLKGERGHSYCVVVNDEVPLLNPKVTIIDNKNDPDLWIKGGCN